LLQIKREGTSVRDGMVDLRAALVLVRAAHAGVVLWLLGLASLAAAAGASQALTLDTARLRAPGALQAQEVALPDPWNPRGREGDWEYLLGFDLPARPAEPWGIYIPRAGNRFAVYVNDRQIGQFGGFAGDRSDHAQRPHFLFIPEGLLVEGRNQLRLRVQGEKARYAGLSSLTVGPAGEVRTLFLWREAVQTWGSFAIVFVSLVFGLIALALAASVRDRSFGVFAAACLFCALRTSYAVVSDPPMDYRAWSALLDASYAGYLSCLCLFCVERLRLRQRWIAWATGALLAGTVVLLPLFAWGRVAPARQLFLAMMVLYAFALCLAVIAAWYRHRTPASRVLAAAGAVSVALAIHDHVLVFYTKDGYGSFALARYSLITFLVAMGWLLIDRYSRQAVEEARLRQQVSVELAQKKRELEVQFDRQQQLAAENAQQHERRRLLQDLHDGMGLQLNSLLGMLQNGPLQRDELAREVRTAIEQMRMLMDSTEDFDGDVSILLGHIRYRIEQRLQRQGIRLEWDVHLAQPQRVLPAHRAIARQRLVFELATNTLKHAGAGVVTLSARDGESPVAPLVMVYADNGRGFAPVAAAQGVGMGSIARRVADLGARLQRGAGETGGVRYELVIASESFARDAARVPRIG
jgi:signal transduction histidine kinase